MDNNEFDYEMLGKYNAQTATASNSLGIGEELFHGGIAAVADFATTAWNSLDNLAPDFLVGGEHQASTADLLSRIDSDALQVYNEHPDAVRTASMVGGAFGVAGLAMKGMSALRAGASGMSWFSEAGQAAQYENVANIVKNVGVASDAYSKARTALYAGMAANAVVDNVAMEAAIVATMNSHPYMEDYMKDFGSNFLLWSAVGSGLGVGLGAIGVRQGIRNTIEPIEQGMLKTVMTGMESVPEAANLGNQLLIRSKNIDNWESTLARSANPLEDFQLDKYTEDTLKLIVQREKAAVNETFLNIAKGELKDAPIEQVTALAEQISKDIRFGNVDTIEWVALEDKIPYAGLEAPKGLLDGVQSLVRTVINPKTGIERVASDQVAFVPEFNAFVNKQEMHNYTNIADTGIQDLEELKKSIRPNDYVAPRKDAAEAMLIDSAGRVELDYAKTSLFVEGKGSIEQINKIPMHPDDLPLMKAVYKKLQEMPEEANAYKGILTKEPPSYSTAQRMAINEAGFSLKYMEEIKTINANRAKYQVYDGRNGKILDTSLSQGTIETLSNWLHGSYNELRKAALAIANPDLAKSIKVSETASKALEEFKNSARSVEFRRQLSKLADPEGNVLMYRGMRNDPKGHHALESFSLNPGKAKAFSGGSDKGLRLYKVHVDDVVGTMEDYATTSDKSHSNMEILVMNRNLTRENAVIPKNNIEAAPSKFFGAEGDLIVNAASPEKGVTKITMEDLKSTILATQARMERAMKIGGHSPEAIAKRLGMPTEAYKDLGSSTILSRFNSEEDILKALTPENRTLLLGTNMRKQLHTEIRTNLTAKNLDQMNADIVGMHISSSKDPIVRGLGELLGSSSTKTMIDALINGIDHVTQTGLKSTMFRSINSALERFGEVGAISTILGKDMTHYKNATTESLTKPISEAMSSVIKDEVKLVEANIALQVQASLKDSQIIFKDGKFITRVKDPITRKMKEVVATYKGSEFQIQSPEVRTLFEEFQKAGRTLYELNNTKGKILGTASIRDRGFWVPSYNPRGKEIAYVLEADRTQIIIADTVGELKDKIASAERTFKEEGRVAKIITKGVDQKTFNELHGRTDPLSMQMADVSMKHSGASAQALISTNSEQLIEMLNSYDHYIRKGITDLADIQLQPVMDRLKIISDLSQSGHNTGAMSALQSGLKKPKDPGMVVRNTLLGNGQLSQNEGWMHLQQNAQIYSDLALKEIASFTTPLLQEAENIAAKTPLLNRVVKGGRTEEEWTKLNDKLGDMGLKPFSVIEDFLRYKNEGVMVSQNLTPRLITLTNGAVATSLLKFLELAQPLVNMISVPILMSGAMRRINAKSFMGATYNPNTKFNLIENLYEGVRLMNNPEGAKWAALAKEKNLFESVVSEANQALAHAKSMDPGLMSKAERVLNSHMMNVLSTPANYSEKLVREVAFYTGVNLAKKAYPGISDVGVMTYARGFMDEAIGNYTSSQRPAFFQGTFGVAMGLFQTYMLTMAQQIYRGIEYRDWVGLSKQMFAQSAIFGMGSLPGFNNVSEMIGKHFSDNHVDLKTGTFRAVGDEAGTILLYGLPSSIGPGIVTRGDIQPRVPNPFSLDQLAAVNITKQAWDSIDSIARAAFNTNGNTARAVMESLSVQSVSRPIARLSELAQGYSMTKDGNIINANVTANPLNEHFTTTGLLSRIFATRPVEEIKAREAKYMDSTYRAYDSEKRAEYIKQLRTHIRDGNLNPQKVQELQYEYMRTGSPTGWRSIVNDALRQKNQSGSKSVKDTLRPSAPYQVMVDDLDP